MAARFVTWNPAGGEDYTTLSAAEAGEQTIGSNLVSAGDTLEIQAAGTWSSADTTAATINGFTTSSTNWIKVSVDSANRHAGAWDAAKARMVVAGASIAITVNDLHVSGVGLQIEQTGGAECWRQSELGGLLDACIMRGRQAIGVTGASAAVLVRNCLWADGSVEAMRRGISINTSTATGRCHNVTYVGTANSSTNPAYCSGVVGGVLITNNCLFKDTSAGSPVGWGGTGAASISGDYNASSDATAPGGNSIQSATFVFVNEGAGNYLLDTTDASGAKTGGTDLSADANLPVTVDVNGTTRPTTPTIGYSQIAGGDVTLALTGASLTVTRAAGTVAPSASVALPGSGVGVTLAAGTIVPSLSKALTGSAIGVALTAGQVSPSLTIGLTGSALALALAAGTLTYSTSPDITLALSGATLSLALTAGTVTPSTSKALSGATAAILAAAGTVSPAIARALAGAALGVSGAAGTLAPSTTRALTSASLTIARSAGTMTASGGTSLDPIPHLTATWTPGLALTAAHTPGLRLTATWSSTQ